MYHHIQFKQQEQHIDSQYYDSMLLNQTNILAGTYTTTIIDNIGQTFITSTTITQDAKVFTPIFVPQCDPNKNNISCRY